MEPPAPDALSPCPAELPGSTLQSTNDARTAAQVPASQWMDAVCPTGPDVRVPAFPAPQDTTLPDTTTFPADTLEYPDEGDPVDEGEYPGEETYEEDTWDLFEFPAWVGLSFSGGLCATGHYESMFGGALSIGKPLGEYGWLELSAGYTATPLQQSSDLRETIGSSPGMFSAAAVARAFLTSPERSARYHILIGFGVDVLFWTYNTPVQTANEDGGTDAVPNDNLVGIDLRCGFGFTMLRDSGVLLTAEIVPGLKLWFNETGHGFSNDLFSSYGFLALRVQAALEIGE